MGWLRLVGSSKVQGSFAKEPYNRDYIPQKRPMILRSLLIVATPLVGNSWNVILHTLWICVCMISRNISSGKFIICHHEYFVNFRVSTISQFACCGFCCKYDITYIVDFRVSMISWNMYCRKCASTHIKCLPMGWLQLIGSLKS